MALKRTPGGNLVYSNFHEAGRPTGYLIDERIAGWLKNTKQPRKRSADPAELRNQQSQVRKLALVVQKLKERVEELEIQMRMSGR